MMVRLSSIFFLVCAALLTACTHREDRAVEKVLIAPGLTMILPRPSDLGLTIERAQLVTARHGDQVYVFEGRVSATPERFHMVGLDSLGRRAMTITWTDEELSYETAPWLPRQLRPENILADMVVMYWPEAAVRQALGASDGSLVATPQRRSILRDGQELIRVDYATPMAPSPWTGRLAYRHLVWNYQLDIQSAAGAP